MEFCHMLRFARGLPCACLVRGLKTVALALGTALIVSVMVAAAAKAEDAHAPQSPVHEGSLGSVEDENWWGGFGRPGTSGSVRALGVHDGALTVGGSFLKAGGGAANRIARWDGVSWSAIGSGFNSWVNALVTYNGELIAGGNFTQAGDSLVNYISRWDGSAWRPLGSA